MTKRKKNNIIIGSLLAVVLLMAVGYAAFSSVLNISGTGSITSSWNIKITNVEVSNIVGDASDGIGTTFEDLTATINSNLVSPGDSITYDVTVRNDGSLDAVLTNINLSESTNPAISFSTSNLEAGAELKTGGEAILKVTITYNDVTSQPENTSANLNVTLTYEQKGSGTIIPGGDTANIGGQDVELATSGDGLYEDEYESGRYIYRGTTPNNYIEFNDELWRIVAKETDGTYKIIRNELIPQNSNYTTMAYDERNHRTTQNNSYCDYSRYGCGVFAAVSGTFQTPSGSKSGTVTEDSSIKEYLNETYYNTLSSTAQGQMTSHTFNIGAVEYLDESGAEADSIEKNIAGEKKYQWTGNVGLANVSDILKASTNSACKSATDQFDKLRNSETSTCDSNYLLELPDPTDYWTINAFGSESGSFYGSSASTCAWFASFSGGAGCVSYSDADGVGDRGARPVLYLKSTITLEGTGTSSDPFTIS